ncbi:Uncharacterised protein [uncultured archaeon]|nr:Uncharacterised protein [uncultured archaeon]
MKYEELQKSLEKKVAVVKEDKCKCGRVFDTHPDEQQYKIGKEVVCSDCYYDSLGDFLEKNPNSIYHPRKGPLRDSF